MGVMKQELHRLLYLLHSQSVFRAVWHGIRLRIRYCLGRIPCASFTPIEQVHGAQSLLCHLMCLARNEDIPTLMRPPQSAGARHLTQRLCRIAKWSAEQAPGDLVEIGAFRGETTRLLAEIAQQYDRRIVVVDPWIEGTQNCQGGEYEVFQRNVAEFADRIDVIRTSSLEVDTRQRLRARHFCFGYIDGIHTYEAALFDGRSLAHCAGPLVFDDVSYVYGVRLAMRQCALEMKRHVVWIPPCKEGYVLPVEA